MSIGVDALFTNALGLVPPWAVDKVARDTASRRIDFEARGSAKTLTCLHCGAPSQPVQGRWQACTAG